MEAMRDLVDSLKAYLKDRVANPLYVAYCVAWAILNFRLILVLVGDGTWRDKISYIDTSLYTVWWHWAWFGFGYPLCVATAFVLCSPFVHRWTTIFLRERDRKTIEELLRISGETPLPPAAAERLRKLLLTERQSRTDEGRLSNERMGEFAAQIDLLLDENKKLKQQLSEIQSAEADPATKVRDESSADDVSTTELSDLELEKRSVVYPLKESDFVDLPQSTMLKLVARGVTHAQAQVMHLMRNGENFGLDTMQRSLRLGEPFAAKVLLDQLVGLKLFDTVDQRGIYSISSAGRQALNAVMNRGFRPS